MEEVKPGAYKHFKGKIHIVIGVAKHSETMEELVIYLHSENGKFSLWARPKAMFLETIERDDKVMPRFKFIGEQ